MKRISQEEQKYEEIEEQKKRVENFEDLLEDLTKSDNREIKEVKFNESNIKKIIEEVVKQLRSKYTTQCHEELSITKIIGGVKQKLSQRAVTIRKIIKQQLMPKETLNQYYFYIYIFHLSSMKKNLHSSMHKISGPRQMVIFDGEESRLQRRIFREHSTDKIKFCWEQSPINKVNDFNFQKINNVNQQDMDIHVRNSYQLPQLHKRKNLLNNECFVVSPQLTVESESKFGKYAKRYTQDSDIFSLKIPIDKQYSQHSSAYGQFYFQPEYTLTKTKPVFKYHTAKSQILGNSRLEYIKLRQELA
ncbi:unnamed protein product (macronuclear) [Paramecium tetraurelia]|uniref:Uncharacterized protein n=1 Tax=Paramecium tetraurelia TaxID=5888 RepID=A0CBC0_PARTE|nr:uncharacterized protein GSPATT00036870001 [Paramecium tetraurelia]CAK68087.1 unnamed protein product [Paramecium tetraurelia]|eukprot:XP_001435484.1 hypothetical protein (macronuclear) [Paramecium tetraurelia strain d4-2]